MFIDYESGDGAQRCRLQPSAIKVLTAHRQVGPSRPETGGQLFGHYESGRWLIKEATGPGKRDQRSRFRFKPNRGQQNNEIRKFYEKGLHFLGDWHTHPERYPKPSSTDVTTTCRTHTQANTELPGFLLMIVGDSFPEDDCYLSVVGEAMSVELIVI